MSGDEIDGPHTNRGWHGGWQVLREWVRWAPSPESLVARSMTRRAAFDDPYAHEDFETLDGDRSYLVTTPDGVPLAVREVGPTDAPLTVVFAHGFCLRMGSFHFQRIRLSEQWGTRGPDDLL